MTLAPGTRLGPYEIAVQIGAGGMGEVYRAQDTALGRQVAIKVLPGSVAADPERLARFDREARTLAALNHPNIAQIYGLEEIAGSAEQDPVYGPSRALVMELVEGPTLSELITRRAGPSGPAGAPGPTGPGVHVDEALAIAKQIAEALEAAHEQGIIHRDLKPANIKVRDDGTVKVLDFGLAKAMEPAGAGRGFSPAGPAGSEDPACTHSPTITSPALVTGIGVLLGTAAYMSPEQAKGRPADKRSDIWALGCVVFEMLAGRRAFDADDASETLASVLAREPDWTRLPRGVPPALTALLKRALQKDPKQRLADAQDFRLALAGAFDSELATAVGGRELWSTRNGVLVALASFAVVAGVVSAVSWGATTRPVAVTRSTITGPVRAYAEARPVLALSPDGRTVVYAGRDQLYRRVLSELDALPIPGTDGASQPFFSPDGQWIAYTDDEGDLRKIPLEGGASTLIADAPISVGGSWGSSGRVLFGRYFGTLGTVSANGGAIETVSTLRDDEVGHMFPDLLPGERAAVFSVATRNQGRHVAVVSLQTGGHTVLFEGTSPRYLPTGHLLFLRGETLWVVAFDPDTLTVRGEPVPVVEGVHATFNGAAHLAVDGAGDTLVYARRSDFTTELHWVDRQGRLLNVAGTVDLGVRTFDLSRDERYVAIRQAYEGVGLWVLDTTRNVTTSVSEGGADPRWHPSGGQLAFARGLVGQIFSIPSGGGTPTLLFERTDGIAWLHDWSGDQLAVQLTGNPTRGAVVTLGGGGEPVVYDRATTIDQARFSPDAKWIAYNANHTGRSEIYVVPNPPTGERIAVSPGGGVQPIWRRDGTELFYLSLDGTLMATPIDTGNGFRPGTPQALFETPLDVVDNIEQYLASGDGQRFLIPTPVSRTGQTSFVLVEHWRSELERVSPTK